MAAAQQQPAWGHFHLWLIGTLSFVGQKVKLGQAKKRLTSITVADIVLLR
jgi:hypothetical protein